MLNSRRGGGVTACIAFGSNLGNRKANIARALDLLRKNPRIKILKVSCLYATSPVGSKKTLGKSTFLNGCLKIKTDLRPMGLLTELKRIEALLGRKPSASPRPRPIDLDMILYGSLRTRKPFLTLPHPRLAERKFVLLPLAELEPQNRKLQSLLQGLKAPGQNVKLY